MGFAYQFRPIEAWPGDKTPRRERAKFKSTFSATLDLLERELKHLAAKVIVIQADCEPSEIRLDGMLRADAKLRSAAIILSFESKHGPLSYPADRYDKWQDNLRAIALSLEALRSVDRYGVTRRAEQYRGWERLENKPSAPDQSAKVISEHSGYTVAEILSSRESLKDAYRVAAIHSHPDRGGSNEAFKQVSAAYDFLIARVSA